MTIRFQTDIKYEKEMIVSMLKNDDWEYRANDMGINKNLASIIHKESNSLTETTKVNLNKLVNNTYKLFLPYMKDSVKLYSESWDLIIGEFSDIVTKKYSPWQHDEYICNITHYHRGISNWGGNLIARWWKENHFIQRRITAHEILLAHYFAIYRNKYSSHKLTENQVWALAEIFAFSATGLDPEIKNFWPWDNTGYYTNHNYQQIVELQNKMKNPFINMRNFDEYVLKGIKEVKKSKK